MLESRKKSVVRRWRVRRKRKWIWGVRLVLEPREDWGEWIYMGRVYNPSLIKNVVVLKLERIRVDERWVAGVFLRERGSWDVSFTGSRGRLYDGAAG